MIDFVGDGGVGRFLHALIEKKETQNIASLLFRILKRF